MLMTILRVIFFYHFRTGDHAFNNSFDAFLLGLRYDFRIISAILLPVFLISGLRIEKNANGRINAASIGRISIAGAIMLIAFLYMRNNKAGTGLIIMSFVLFALILFWLFKRKSCNPYQDIVSRKIWNWYFIIITIFLVLLYAVDFQHYDYLHLRLNASVLNYLQDLNISLGMVWQSYPVMKLLLGIVILILLLSFLVKRSYKWQKKETKKGPISIAVGAVVFIILGLGTFGSIPKVRIHPFTISAFPLRWSDAFSLNDEFKASVSLNPIQSFFSTLRFRHSSYDEKKVREYYPMMASALKVDKPDSIHLNYERIYNFPVSSSKPNVVVVICESFSAYKSSMWGNPLNTTPYFNEMCNNGVFFDHCFTPAYGTARGVWAVVTGIPDVEDPTTASRNPAAVDQHTIINDLEGYEKYYFLGGNTSWANIRGLLTNNISNLHLYEEGSYHEKAVDVWGISDKHLLLEANSALKEEHKPFFAVIQTADNHRPYTIPSEDKDFEIKDYPLDTLHKYGFEKNDELNAFRYTDYCFKQFIEAAKKESYFSNTIFVFVGDHGIRGNAGNMFPRCWTDFGLTTQHVPLLFYSPSLLQPKRVNNVCSQIDILPSIASLIKVSHRNTTMGKNLFDTSRSDTLQFNNRAFLFDPENKQIGIITDDYCYVKNLITGAEGLASARNNEVIPGDTIYKKALEKLTLANYETAKYLLLNNKKKK
jgi:phosphoglycerol transferase MdoB-like AlkP superfamily enzyme